MNMILEKIDEYPEVLGNKELTYLVKSIAKELAEIKKKIKEDKIPSARKK